MSERVPPFSPAGHGVTVSASVGTQTSVIKFDNVLPGVGFANKSRNVRVANVGSNIIFIDYAGSDPGADVTISIGTAIPIFPGTREILGTLGATAFVAVTQAGASTLYVTPGEGGI